MIKKRIYVAGPYSADNIIQILENIQMGNRACTKLLLSGFAPFCPWHNYQFQLALQDGEKLTVEDYYRHTMAWLEVSDAVLVLPNYEKSQGTLKEIVRAKELGIPVFYNIKTFQEWSDQMNINEGTIQKGGINPNPPSISRPEEPLGQKPLKPAFGLVPRFIFLEKRNSEIINTMVRYSKAGKIIPTEWIIELSKNIEELKEEVKC